MNARTLDEGCYWVPRDAKYLNIFPTSPHRSVDCRLAVLVPTTQLPMILGEWNFLSDCCLIRSADEVESAAYEMKRCSTRIIVITQANLRGRLQCRGRSLPWKCTRVHRQIIPEGHFPLGGWVKLELSLCCSRFCIYSSDTSSCNSLLWTIIYRSLCSRIK